MLRSHAFTHPALTVVCSRDSAFSAIPPQRIPLQQRKDHLRPVAREGLDLAAGLDPTLKEALAARAELYGRNSVPSPPSASFLELLLEALDDFTVKVLLGAGSASLGLEFWLAQQDGSKPNWIEGVRIEVFKFIY